MFSICYYLKSGFSHWLGTGPKIATWQIPVLTRPPLRFAIMHTVFQNFFIYSPKKPCSWWRNAPPPSISPQPRPPPPPPPLGFVSRWSLACLLIVSFLNNEVGKKKGLIGYGPPTMGHSSRKMGTNVSIMSRRQVGCWLRACFLLKRVWNPLGWGHYGSAGV